MTQARPVAYVPGLYGKQRQSSARLADRYMQEWERRKSEEQKKKKQSAPGLDYPHVCFSRKIGVGALEIADILATNTGMPVVDRELIEYIVESAGLHMSTVDFFDERHPGHVNHFAALMFGEKSFTMGDYLRRLANAVLRVAQIESTIFVGRGTHLMLPRDRVLAVRLISSPEHRIQRLAGLLKIGKDEAARILENEDKLQRRFFKTNFSKKDAPPYEFDLVINRDHLPDASHAAVLVEKAFALKFGR